MAEAGSGGEDDERQSSRDDKFAEETETIFKGFMFHRLTSQIEQEATDGDMSVGQIPKPVLKEIENESSLLEKQTRNEQLLGKTLAALGDDVQQKYGDTFVAMTKHLGLSSATAYDTFAKIARRLFNDGINWGRIIALLCFGYEIAFSVIKTGSTAIGQFLKKIISFVVKFIVKEKIGKWIANQGGWFAILDIRKNDSNIWMTRVVIVSLIAIFGLAAMKIGSTFRAKDI